MQTHGVKIDLPAKIAVLEPDPVKNKIVIEADGAVLWNGQRADLTSLARTLEQTKAFASAPELHLQPEPLAPYARVDEVLAVIKRAQVEKMGFVGNEQYKTF